MRHLQQMRLTTRRRWVDGSSNPKTTEGLGGKEPVFCGAHHKTAGLGGKEPDFCGAQQNSGPQPHLELIQIEPGLGIEAAADGSVVPEVLDDEFAGAVDAGAEEMSAHACVVAPPASKMNMEIGFTVLLGDIADEGGDFHLLREFLVDILLGRRIEEAEHGLRHGAESPHLPRQNRLLRS